MPTTTMPRKDLINELKEIREELNIEVNLRATTEKLQETYDYWVTSGRVSLTREIKTLRKMRVRALKNNERRIEIETKIEQLWDQFNALETTEAPQADEPTETTEPIEPLSEVDYKATRNALITKWQELSSKINDEKDAKYAYEHQCKKQGIEPDLSKFDEYIAGCREAKKQIDTKIKDLDIAQGTSKQYYYGLD